MILCSTITFYEKNLSEIIVFSLYEEHAAIKLHTE